MNENIDNKNQEADNKSEEKYITDIISQDHYTRYVQKDDMLQVIIAIIKQVKQTYQYITDENISIHVSKYLRFSTKHKKYFFNVASKSTSTQFIKLVKYAMIQYTSSIDCDIDSLKSNNNVDSLKSSDNDSFDDIFEPLSQHTQIDDIDDKISCASDSSFDSDYFEKIFNDIAEKSIKKVKQSKNNTTSEKFFSAAKY